MSNQKTPASNLEALKLAYETEPVFHELVDRLFESIQSNSNRKINFDEVLMLAGMARDFGKKLNND